MKIKIIDNKPVLDQYVYQIQALFESSHNPYSAYKEGPLSWIKDYNETVIWACPKEEGKCERIFDVNKQF